MKRKEILKEPAVGWHDKVTWVVKSLIVLHVIIALYITRSIDHTCKAVSQLTFTQLRNFHLPGFQKCTFGIYEFKLLKNFRQCCPARTKIMYTPCKRSAFLQILLIFCSPHFTWVFYTRHIAEHGMWYQNKALDLLEEFEKTEQESGDKGIKKNNLKISIMKEFMRLYIRKKIKNQEP